jgi:hypothetical protein
MRFSFVLLIGLTISSLVLAGNTAQQKVTYRIDPINEISINGGENSLVLSLDDSKTQGNATWAVTTNESKKRVMGSLDTDLPPGVKLYVELEAPESSVSKGVVSLSTNPQDLVTQISRVAKGDLNITYNLVTEADISKIEIQRVLTIVLTDGF